MFSNYFYRRKSCTHTHIKMRKNKDKNQQIYCIIEPCIIEVHIKVSPTLERQILLNYLVKL